MRGQNLSKFQRGSVSNIFKEENQLLSYDTVYRTVLETLGLFFVCLFFVAKHSEH